MKYKPFYHERKRYVEVPMLDLYCGQCALAVHGAVCRSIDCFSRKTIVIRDTKDGRDKYLVDKTKHRLGIEENDYDTKTEAVKA